MVVVVVIEQTDGGAAYSLIDHQQAGLAGVSMVAV